MASAVTARPPASARAPTSRPSPPRCKAAFLKLEWVASLPPLTWVTCPLPPLPPGGPGAPRPDGNADSWPPREAPGSCSHSAGRVAVPKALRSPSWARSPSLHPEPLSTRSGLSARCHTQPGILGPPPSSATLPSSRSGPNAIVTTPCLPSVPRLWSLRPVFILLCVPPVGRLGGLLAHQVPPASRSQKKNFTEIRGVLPACSWCEGDSGPRLQH